MDQRRPPHKGGYAGNAARGPRPNDRPRGRRTGHPTPKAGDDGEDRLQKVLAHAGIGSRRGCEELILKGRVTINGKVVRELGTKVDPLSATVAVDGQKIQVEKPVYYAVYKPKGYVSTNNDPSGRPRVLDILPEIPQRVYTVGRLDEMSVGLIILTNDGTLAHKLAHPKYGVEKLYRVVVAGSPPREVLTQLTEGIWLAEGKVRAKKVRAVGKRGESTILEMVLSEGKNREVRRMLAKLGHKVMSLTRIAVGPVTIKGLSAGQYRPLTSLEVSQLRKVADGEFIAPFGADRKRTMKTDRPRPTMSSSSAPTGPGSRRPALDGPGSPAMRRPAAGRPAFRPEGPAVRRDEETGGPPRRPPGHPAFRPEGPAGRREEAPGPVIGGAQRRPTGRPAFRPEGPPSRRDDATGGPPRRPPGRPAFRAGGPAGRRDEGPGPVTGGPPRRPPGRPAFRPEGPGERMDDAPGPVTGGPQRRPTFLRPEAPGPLTDGPPRRPPQRPSGPGGPSTRPPRPAARRPDEDRLVPPSSEDYSRPSKGRRVIGLEPAASPPPADRPPPRPAAKRPAYKPKPPRRAPGPMKSRRPGRQSKGQ